MINILLSNTLILESLSLRKESWTKFSCKILMYLFDNVGRRLENEMDIRAYRNVYATSTLQGIDREQKGIWKLQSLVDASWFSQFFGDTCVRFKLHGVTDGACVLHLKKCKLGSENIFLRGCAGCTNHCVETIGMESVTTKEDNHSGRWFPGILGKKNSTSLQSNLFLKVNFLQHTGNYNFLMTRPTNLIICGICFFG